MENKNFGFLCSFMHKGIYFECEINIVLQNAFSTCFQYVKFYFSNWGLHHVSRYIQGGLLACWQGHFGRLRNGVIWKIVPPCLMWCIWKERNNRCFEDSERAIPDIKLLFFRTLLEWFSVWRNHSFSLLDLLDFCNFSSC